MSIDSQPRDTDGQYGHKHHSAPEVYLAENVDGSFLFPPSEWPGGARQYLEFWKTQPISDEALTNFASCYAAEWDDWAHPLIREHLELWGDSEAGRQARMNTTTGDELRKLRLQAADAFEARLEATRPKRIPTGIVRQVARAAQIMYNTPHLRDEEDRNAVGSEVLHRSQSGEPWTAAMFWDNYRLHEIMPDAFYSRENALLREFRNSQAR